MKCNFAILKTVALVSALSFAASSAQATQVYYPNFNSAAGLTLVGSANITAIPGQLQLTPNLDSQSGAAYSTTPITLGTSNSFSTQFQFQITNPGGYGPADGIVFVLAKSPTGLGAAGGQIGYGGVNNSVGIEFDTWNNGYNDGNSSNHVAIDMNGNITNGTSYSDQALTNVYGIQTCNGSSVAGCMSNGDKWTATITYNGTNLNVSLYDPKEGYTINAIQNYGINVGSFLGTNTAYVGFTAGTGAGNENHNILSWQFSNTSTLPAAPIPEPETYAMLLAGLGLLIGFIAYRRKNNSSTMPMAT